MIRLSDVSKTYGKGDSACRALKHIDLDIREGEFLMVLGPSGSGKSTLLNMIGCMDVPTEGSITYDDMTVTKLSEDARARFRNEKVGFIFQNFQLMPALSVYENVAMPFLVAKKKVDDRRIKDLLEQIEIAEKANVLPGKLSGGQQQRVAIARALVMRPALLLADEPTGNLDSVTGETVIELMTSMKSAGQTIVMITHNEKLTLHGSRVVRMKDGTIVE